MKTGRILAGAAVLLLAGRALAGDLVLGTVGVAVVETFDAFRGTPASLPCGFSVSKDGQTTMGPEDDDFRGVSAGNVTAGGCYAWAVGREDRALGYQPTADEFTPGSFAASISNGTGVAIHACRVSFEIVFLNNADRATSLDLEYSLDGASFAPVPGASFVTPAGRGDSSAWKACSRSAEVLFHPHLPPGARVWLRWKSDDAGGSGSRDEVGLNRVSVAARGPEGTLFTAR